MDGLLRLRDIVGDKKRGEKGLIQMSKSSWWMGVRAGRLPQPVKLGPRTTAWKESDIRKLIEQGIQ